MKNNNYKKQFKLDQVGFYFDKYLDKKRFVHAPSTFKSNVSRCNKMKKKMGNLNIKEVNHSLLIDWMNSMHSHSKNKTINEYVTILKATFDIAVRDNMLSVNPAQGLEKLPVSKSEVNPFTKSELQVMINARTPMCSEQNLISLNALTGLRCSEIIALSWEDIDFENKVLRVRKANVDKVFKVPKTVSSVRNVELNELAIEVLKRQQLLTANTKGEIINVLQGDNKTKKQVFCTFVFTSSITQKRFIDIKQFQESFFTEFLADLDIMHRGPSQLRHTYASQLLTAGISKEWLAKQMGHTSTAMIDRHYGRWISEDSPNYNSLSDRHMYEVFSNTKVKLPTKEPTNCSSEVQKLIDKLSSRPDLVQLINAIK